MPNRRSTIFAIVKEISGTNSPLFSSISMKNIQKEIYSFIHERMTTTYSGEIFCYSGQKIPSYNENPIWLISINLYKMNQLTNNFCLSIAIIENNTLIQGCVYDYRLNNLYYAEKKKGAFLNGQPIYRDELIRLKEAEIRIHSSFLQKEQPLNPSYQRVRMAELPTALETCSVAEGDADIFMTMNQIPHEFAAASLIAKEAGVDVMTLEGQELCWNKVSSVWCGVV
ncbi:inositol monophosphatase family protein [Shouchella hunanensis]|uniref:Uncharacterized protein n=1 Tax=Shouchella hunanensis TaxID=766894 RepID=A0ABY7W3I3_9BACI|nr:inositol monophosphatase family protein [Shouchella hunanensis]WDF02023.1 hypothetical protein PQ477_10855 [Shouchella hunanensis]